MTSSEAFNIAKIPPLKSRVEDVEMFIYGDLRRMGETKEDAESIANPSNPRLIKAVQKNIARAAFSEKMYTMATKGENRHGETVGIIISNTWLQGDQAKYDDQVLGENKPVGVFEFIVDEEQDDKFVNTVANALIESVTNKADSQNREVRMASYDEDPRSDTLKKHGFEIVDGLSGVPIGKTVQKLLIREARKRLR